MPSNLGATFVPGAGDDYYMPEVVAPSPQRVTPQLPQNMQDGLQRMELEARESNQPGSQDDRTESRLQREPSLSSYVGQKSSNLTQPQQSQPGYANADANIVPYKHEKDGRTDHLDKMAWDAPSFSPFPKVKGDNVPPTDDDKEEILWNARKHVLHSQNVPMQIIWARDVLLWADVALEASLREASVTDRPRPATPRMEHELRVDAINIITYLSSQEHPEALYLQSKWQEFGKFGNRIDKREAYTGYKRAAELGNARSEYRMGMLYEQSNDMSKAKEHYYKGLSLKDSAALYRMGMMSLLGQHGESKDYARGVERIRAAADSADEDAPQGAYMYGMLIGRDLPDIELPDGVLPHNMETAKMYVEKAAYLGFAKAQLKIGQAYELCQLSCEFNPSYSLHYYGLAAKQGLPEAALGVSRWFLFGYEGVFKKNEELAYKYAQEASVAKLPTAAFAMGYYHEIGIHVNKNIIEAKKWYQIAADQGNGDAVGRLDSLNEDRSLSKKDHETTTLTRIKSQHGSQRGQRPERFKHTQQMAPLEERSGPPTPVQDIPPSHKPSKISDGLSPRLSPQPSPGMRPTVVSDYADYPDFSRASIVGSDRPSAFNVRLDGGVGPPQQRPQSAMPYPNDRPTQPNISRPKSTAPYPDDDVRASRPLPQNPGTGRPLQGPPADRPGSAFGIKTQGGPRPMPSSQSMGNLQPPSHSPDPRGRVASWGEPQKQYRAPSPGQPGRMQQQQQPQQPYPMDAGYSSSRQSGPAPYPSNNPGNNPGNNRLQKPPPKGYSNSGGGPSLVSGHATGADSGRLSQGSPPKSRPLSDMPSQNPDRFARQPDTSIRTERLSSLPAAHNQYSGSSSTSQGNSASRPLPSTSGAGRPMLGAPSSASSGSGRTGAAHPGQGGSGRPGGGGGTPGPATPASFKQQQQQLPPGKGPATFEDMGIPQGKQDSDCSVM